MLTTGAALKLCNRGMDMSRSRGLHPSPSLVALMLCLSLLASSMATASVLAQDSRDREDPLRALKGNLVLRVYPNGTVKARATGGLEQALRPGETRLPAASLTCDFTVAPKGFNQTEIRLRLLAKPDPQAALLLSGLRLNLRMHSEETWSDLALDFDLPGLLGANGSIHSTHAGDSLEGETSLDLTFKVWYGEGTPANDLGLTRDLLEDLVVNFDVYKEVFQELLGEYTDGNLTLTELTLSRADLGDRYGTLTVHAQVNGSYAKAARALAATYAPSAEAMEAIERLTEELTETRFTKTLSADASIVYDRVERAFNVEFTGLIEGDLDREVNAVKNAYLRYLEESMPQLSYGALGQLKEFLLPTNVSLGNLHASFEYRSSEASQSFSFTIEGLAFQPPKPEDMLPFLEEASFETPMPSFNLTLEGGSDEEQMVEIQVPETVAPPLEADPYRAVWAFANLTELHEVMFKVKPNTWGVTDFHLQAETAVIAGAPQPIAFVTNSTILDEPEVTEDHISLRVEGPSGTRGALNITMPAMNGVILATVNGLRVEPQVASNGTHYFVYLQYGQSVDTIQVVWPAPTATLELSQAKVETGQSLTLTGSLTAAGEPLASRVLRVMVDGQPVGTVVTDAQGSYSYSTSFDRAGSYELKTVFPYYAKSFESPAAALTVEVPLLQRPEILAGIAGVIAVVVVLGYAFARRERKAVGPSR